MNNEGEGIYLYDSSNPIKNNEHISKIDLLSYKYKIHSLLANFKQNRNLQSVLFIYSKNNKNESKKLNMNNIRIDWIDLTKGIAIFLMVLMGIQVFHYL